MMTSHDEAPYSLTVVGSPVITNLAEIVPAIESNVIPFPVRLEIYRDGETPAPVQCDSFLGMCEGCGTPTYTSESPRVVDGEITCPQCLAEESGWFVPCCGDDRKAA
jgi:hypothetical protein